MAYLLGARRGRPLAGGGGAQRRQPATPSWSSPPERSAAHLSGSTLSRGPSGTVGGEGWLGSARRASRSGAATGPDGPLALPAADQIIEEFTAQAAAGQRRAAAIPRSAGASGPGRVGGRNRGRAGSGLCGGVDPVGAAVGPVLLLPDRHQLPEPVDGVAAGLQGGPVRAADRHRHAHLADPQPAQAVDRRPRADRPAAARARLDLRRLARNAIVLDAPYGEHDKDAAAGRWDIGGVGRVLRRQRLDAAGPDAGPREPRGPPLAEPLVG